VSKGSLPPSFENWIQKREVMSQIDQVAQSTYWLRLLHYKRNWPYGALQSQLKGPDFFFAVQGSTDAKAELIESLRGFFENKREIGYLKQKPQCAFPERYRYLKSIFHLPLMDENCPKFNEYVLQFEPKSVSLIFSSAYPNNPGSMYGHTFLRIKSSNRPDLLEYGISYAARVADDSNGFEFIWLGLTGGYRGQFSMLPYYAKINEYINSESRDLWEYDLNLNEQETRRMLAHLWEIEINSWFDYYFFDQNCSFQILAAIEIAKPEWELADSNLFTVPAETVKKLTHIPKAITQVKYRPSLRKQMMIRYEKMTSAEKQEFSQLITYQKDPQQIPSVRVLDAASTYLSYVKQSKKQRLDSSEKELFQKILVQRSEVSSEIFGDSNVKSDIQDGQEIERLPTDVHQGEFKNRPDLGHYPTRIGLLPGIYSGSKFNSKSSFFQELSFKFAYHDLLNNDVGYTPFSHIDFPGITFRYYSDISSFNVENITAFSITSLFPWTFLDKKLSWKIQLDYYSPKDFGDLTSHALRFEGGGGITFHVFSPQTVFYILALGDVEAGSIFLPMYRLMPKLQFAILTNPIDTYKARIAIATVTEPFQSERQKMFYELNFDQSLSLSPSWEVRFLVDLFMNTSNATFTPYREMKLALHYYF
jgi:hypothetical protein